MAYPDFPRSLPDFIHRFPNDEACIRYLIQVRWPDGFKCPMNDGRKVSYYAPRHRFQCSNGHQVSVTAGTIMHRSKVPICLWFWAAYLISTQTPGMSALQFARQMGLHYETAYMMLQRLRAGMVNPSRSQLNSQVEIDESYIGGKKAGKAGRGARGKAIVVGAVEVRGQSSGRVRLRKIPYATSKQILQFILRYVQRGTTIITDGLAVYRQLPTLGYKHIIRHGKTSKEVAKQLPYIHRIFGNLKSWLIGTHHGVSPKHLQAYLNEFTFRFNRRGNPMAAFNAVLGIGTQVQGPTYRGIYRGTWLHPNIRYK